MFDGGQQKLPRIAVPKGVIIGKDQRRRVGVRGKKVAYHAQFPRRAKSNRARLTVGQHGTASGPGAGAGFDEALPASQTAQANTVLLQKAVAQLKQGIVALTLALREFDGEADNAVRGEHCPGERGRRGAVDFWTDEALEISMPAIAALRRRGQPETIG